MNFQDVELRLEELGNLRQDWWVGGMGQPIPRHILDGVKSICEYLDKHNIALPYIYPSPDGSVEMEWDTFRDDGRWGMSITVDDSRVMEAAAYNHQTDSYVARSLEFGNAAAVEKFLTEIDQSEV